MRQRTWALSGFSATAGSRGTVRIAALSFDSAAVLSLQGFPTGMSTSLPGVVEAIMTSRPELARYWLAVAAVRAGFFASGRYTPGLFINSALHYAHHAEFVRVWRATPHQTRDHWNQRMLWSTQ